MYRAAWRRPRQQLQAQPLLWGCAVRPSLAAVAIACTRLFSRSNQSPIRHSTAGAGCGTYRCSFCSRQFCSGSRCGAERGFSRADGRQPGGDQHNGRGRGRPSRRAAGPACVRVCLQEISQKSIPTAVFGAAIQQVCVGVALIVRLAYDRRFAAESAARRSGAIQAEGQGCLAKHKAPHTEQHLDPA